MAGVRDQFLYLRVLKLYSNGYDYEAISQKVGVSSWRVQRMLQELNQRSRGELGSILTTELALHYKASVTLLKSIQAKCSEIVESQKDPRVVLQALTLSRDSMKDLTMIYSEAAAVAKLIDRLESSGVKSIQDRHQQFGMGTIEGNFKDTETTSMIAQEGDREEVP